MLELALLSISSFTNILLGLVVYRKNSNSATNRFFIMLATSFAVWSSVNYVSVHPFFFSQIVWVRLVLFCAAFLCLSVYLTFTVFPAANVTHKSRLRKFLVYYTPFVMALTLTPFVFVLRNGHPSPSFGIPLFTLLVILTLGGGIYELVRKYKVSKSKQRAQFRIVLLGIAGSIGLIFLTNFLLVVVFNNTAFIPLGPTFTLIFSGSLAYAIIKHHLFDIRSAAARALAYLLSLGSLIAIYGLIVFGISERFFQLQSSGTLQRAFYIGFAVASSLLYQPLKVFFDKITNKIFFQDAYNPQDFLDELNNVLVENIELEKLLAESTRVLEKNLKTNFCVFTIRETSYFPQRIIGDTTRRFESEDIQEIGEVSSHIRDKVIITDYLDESNHLLKRVLDKNDTGLLIRLVATLDYEVQGVGHILFGTKKSGNPYTKQDIQTMEIIANELVIAIQNALRFEEIEKFNVTLQEKIDDATKRLQKTNEKLKALDETKDEFISMASHQLRTPLTSVKGYLSMVLEGDAGETNEMQHKLLDQAFISSQRMVYLIADLLNVSRLRTGKFIIEPIATNLADVVEGELSQLTETAKGHKLELTYNKPENFPTLMLDETKIRQVIMNFADNAIYYTPSGGHINVVVEDKDKTIEFRVEDDGLGVPKSEQHHLFTKFYRAGNAKKARPDGTGLGLFMAKKVVVAQGGTLIFESQEGKGSTFGFSFDKSKLQAQLPPSTDPAPIETEKSGSTPVEAVDPKA